MKSFSRIPAIAGFVLAICFFAPPPADAAEKEKKPAPANYWMSVSTENQSIPGMRPEEMSGLEGMFGRMAGMPQGGAGKRILLQLNSPRPLPSEPEALHDIPAGQKMGKALPLEIPARPKYTREGEEEERVYEKPKMRMLIYWGCSETVGKGQPRVLDTAHMGMAEFGKAMSGRTASRQYPPSPRAGRIYADWPNRLSSLPVPKDSSLEGDHLVHGNYTPDIRFTVDRDHDFMAPVEFSSVKGGLEESIRFNWKKIPTAIGYFAQAMTSNEKTGEMIFWSSSELPDAGFGLLDYLPPADVRKFIKDRVVMSPETTNCAIPKGIFKGTDGAMLQFIAYGDELNLAHPPRPKDPKAEWNPIWTMKLRLKSTGFTPLGMESRGDDSRPALRDRETPESTRQREEPAQEEGGTLRKLRGIFGF